MVDVILGILAFTLIMLTGQGTLWLQRRTLRQWSKRIGDAYDEGCDHARVQCGCPECMMMHRMYQEHGSSIAVYQAMQHMRQQPPGEMTHA